MPSIVSQRSKLDTCPGQQVSVVQQISNGDTAAFITFLPATTEGLTPAGSPPAQPAVTPGMTSASNPAHSKGHPIDELTSEPIDIGGRTSQLRTESSTSSNGSSDFGPFVSGFGDEPRPRSSSFNSSILRGQRTSAPPRLPVADTVRRLSEAATMTRTGSADNVTAPHGPYGVLRHSNTAPEIYPLALSNDSGYHTPPQNRQHPSNNTSPPWPSSRHTQWPVPPPGHYPPPADAGMMCNPAPMRPLTIDTGHFQPEQNSMLGHPPAPYLSIQHVGYNTGYPQPPYGSLQSHGSANPLDGVCAYQQDRKMRLAAALQVEESEVDKLKVEEQQLRQLLDNELKSNCGIDNSATEMEVENMTKENQLLAAQIQRLMQVTPSLLPVIVQPRPVEGAQHSLPPSTIAHIGVPPVAPTPAPRVNSPSRPVVCQPQSPPAYTNGSVIAPSIPPLVHPIVPPCPLSARQTPGAAPAPPVHMPEDSPQWACSQCTYLNHHLVEVCEMCETPRPRTGNANPTSTGLVKTSSCQHNSGCFCHAHLG